jgi:hypothetical protein
MVGMAFQQSPRTPIIHGNIRGAASMFMPADVAVEQWVRWFRGLTCDFLEKNEKNRCKNNKTKGIVFMDFEG